MKKSLQSSEWILVFSFLSILVSLVLVASVQARRFASAIASHELHPVEPVSVRIEGAVHKPGTYPIIPGTLLSQVVKKARPKASADLKKLNLKSRIEESVHLHIEELAEIVVWVKGAVKDPMEIHLPIGSRVSDLKSKILCEEDANIKFFKSRRKLKNGEILEVPQKTIVKNSASSYDPTAY